MKKSLRIGFGVLLLSLISQSAQAKEVCYITVNNPPTNVRPWAGLDNKPVHVIKEITTLNPIETQGEFTFVEVWVKDSTYVKGWIHKSQFTKECFDSPVYTISFWNYYDMGENAKTKGDYNTALINYNRAKAEYLLQNPDKAEASDDLEGLILLMEQKRKR